MARSSLARNLLLSLLVAVAYFSAAAPRCAEAEVTCPEVYGVLMQCVPYLRSGGTPAPQCCSGIQQLLAAASTTADRRTACQCLKTAAAGLSGLNLAYAVALPGKCGVSFPYKITPNIDCSTIP
uniref:Non-specific lipid-transfer protein n=1 Tax=Ananas comosus var. bracteatus TaxID=296719 RepID=A0A6V7NFX5_ANACO|nr:unnamed protein product [Ananas comosus var. bracteatus]